MTEICFWSETVKRWRKEGLPEESDPLDFFEMDKLQIGCPFDNSLMLDKKVIEENEEYVIASDGDGIITKSWKNNYSPPVEMDFFVKTKEDWERVKGALSRTEERFYTGSLESYKGFRSKNLFFAMKPMEPVWYALRILGFERALSAMVIEPEFFDEIVSDYTDFIIRMIDTSWNKGFRYDAIWFFSDLCYRNGMLFSPKLYRERFMQYHRAISGYCRDRGMPLILHCDGDVSKLIPLAIESGFDCIQPLEARAGNDVRKLIEIYGDSIGFFGNINMDVLARGDRSEIEDEVVTKVESAKRGKKYIFHSDHSVPPTVSFESYAFACELAKKHGFY